MSVAGRATRSISAAGTVVLRTRKDGKQEVLLVHRPKYNDWSLPKGKIDPDEYLAGCAVRETLEETSVQVRLGVPIDRIRYPVSAGTKSVSYWRGYVVSTSKRKPDGEVDEVRWVTVAKALTKISYPDELPLIEQALAQPNTTPVMLVRHSKAMLRKFWSGRDQARPLDTRGRRQAQLLVPLLDAYGIKRLASSSSARCMQTLKPYSKVRRIDIEGWTTLSEEQAKDNPKAVETLVRRLVREAVETRTPLAICGHRPVLPTMLNAVGVPLRPLQPGAALVAHLDDAGKTVAVEFHKPRI